jgi:hypothetical protein
MQTLVLWWRQHMKPLRRAAITMQRIARGFLVRLRQYGRRLVHLQARVRGVLARLAWARQKIAFRKQERRRWLTEQADIGMAVFHGVRDILNWMETNEAKVIVKQEKAIMKVGVFQVCRPQLNAVLMNFCIGWKFKLVHHLLS